jgi:PKD repeat protein
MTWYFGDGYSSSFPNPSHAYTTAGCYNVDLAGLVPEDGNPGSFCVVSTDIGVCVPIASFFDFDYLGCAAVQFNDLSTFIAGPGNDINYWEWNFGFGPPVLGQSPSVTFPGGGYYTVTLTVANSNGCIATYTDVVFIDSVGIPTINSPLSACQNEGVSLSAFAAGAVSYSWDFDDNATYVGSAPQHTWLNSGTFTITVTATNADGCSETSTATIVIHPEVPDGSITASSLLICQGNTATLCAPSGYSYVWQPGLETTQCITTGAGTYSVTLTDSNGCDRELDPVTIEEVPLPQAVITGDPVICNSGCTTLSAAYGVGYYYQWYTGSGVPIPGGVSQYLIVCDFDLDPTGYIVEVTDANGCKAISVPFTVVVKPTPSVDILVSPSFCEGTPTTLTANPNLSPDVTYAWSTGQSGPSIIVTTAGTYTVIATNNDTGCSASDNVTINPQPDLCIMPVGCYEACNPDTICGPPGLSSYEWLYNGVSIPGATNQCLEVTLSGSYNLVGTNAFGCSDTSGVLVLQLIDCPSDNCDEVTLDYAFLTDADGHVDNCCASLSYSIGSFPLIGVNIHSSDADILINSIHPQLTPQTILSNSVSLSNAIIGSYLPTGTLNNFFSFCLSNAVNYPQQVIIDWYDTDAHVACSDTIQFNCPVEPDCLYLQNDSIYCKGLETIYEFTVCNPSDASFNIGYIALNPTSPAGITLSSTSFDISASPILPGSCATFSLALLGTGIAGQTFCYQIVAHEQNPNLVPNGLCCSLDATYCIEIPNCDPCGSVGVADVHPADEADCCYSIALYNNFSPSHFDEIALCVISPQTTFTINNPFGSGWFTSGYTGTAVSLIPSGMPGGFVPSGNFNIPEICIETGVAPNQQVEIKWLKDGYILCSDTVNVFCEPDCGYITEEEIFCDPAAGIWVFQGFIKNTADYVVSEAVISFSDPGMNIYNTTIPVGPMNPGDMYGPISFSIGPPAVAGQELCFTVTLHEINSDGIYLNCCNFTHCITLPDCQFDLPCLCDENFYNGVAMGIDCSISPFNSMTYTFSLTGAEAGLLGDCDEGRWVFGDQTSQIFFNANTSVVHTYATGGPFTVCAKVKRIASNGEVCKTGVCKEITVLSPESPDPDMVFIYPNPTEGFFNVKMSPELLTEGVYLNVLDNTGRSVDDVLWENPLNTSLIQIDMGNHSKGIYTLHFQTKDKSFMRRVVIH